MPKRISDKERLDFITKGHTEMGRSSSGVAVILQKDGLGEIGRFIGATPRAAIDAAIAAEKESAPCHNTGIGHHCFVEMNGKRVRNPNCWPKKRAAERKAGKKGRGK